MPTLWQGTRRAFTLKQAQVMKTCTKCGRTLPLDSFYRDSMYPDGRRNVCKECRHSGYFAQRGDIVRVLSRFTTEELEQELARRRKALGPKQQEQL